MTREELIQNIRRCGEFRYARSGGPGGQNVNKVNTKVLLILPLEGADFLSEEQKGRIRRKLAGRINTQDEIFLQIQDERSQLLNREIAVTRTADLILEALKKPKRRKKTAPTRASRERRLQGKKKRSETKKNRGRISRYD